MSGRDVDFSTVTKFSIEKQRQLDDLLDKNSSGTIKTCEIDVLTHLVSEAEELMVANARQLAESRGGLKSEPPVNADRRFTP